MIRMSWTQAASVEETLALWAASLREIKQRIRPLFTQERVATNAGLFLEGLLGDEQRKTGWMRAEAAGDPGPWRQQAILGRGDWDADALRDIVHDYVIEHLADDDAVLVIDETGFLKQGKASCGVARQYTGSAGKITNCQIGVFAAYVSRHGHAFIDRALYLPKEWTDDPDRLEATYVPADVGFATKPKLATRMIARAIAASWLPVIPSTVLATSSSNYVGQAALMCSDPGQATAGRRYGCRPRPDAALIRLEAPVGRSRNQRTAAARLVLSRIGRSRGRAVQQCK
jgi:SRSO17 transposase